MRLVVLELHSKLSIHNHSIDFHRSFDRLITNRSWCRWELAAVERRNSKGYMYQAGKTNALYSRFRYRWFPYDGEYSQLSLLKHLLYQLCNIRKLWLSGRHLETRFAEIKTEWLFYGIELCCNNAAVKIIIDYDVILRRRCSLRRFSIFKLFKT